MQMFKSVEYIYGQVNSSAIFHSVKISRIYQVMSQRNTIQTQIRCSDCGKAATVPFKPTADKPVYCRECLAKHRTKRPTEGRIQNPNVEKQAWSRRRENWK
jgi:CxxC-x17-CxxC domain-containing protein